MEFDQKDPFLVIDVGGGSTEISIFKKGEKVASKSFRIGTIRLIKGKVKRHIWEDLAEWIEKYLKKGHKFKTFATGGNINKLHKLMGKKSAEPIDVSEMKELSKKLRKLNIDDRISDYNLKPDRADVIVPACEIYEFIFNEIGTKEVYVPKIGLSDGMIYNLHQKWQEAD